MAVFSAADNDFALVFVAAQLALDGNMSTFGESGNELSKPSKGDTPMPLGAGFPASGVILPRRFGGEREHRDVRCVADLPFAIAAEKTDEGDSVEVHTFLLFCPSV